MSERRYQHVTAALAALLSIALVWAVLSVPYVPTNDGPQAIYGAWMHNHFAEPGQDFSRYVGVHDPLTWAGFSWLFRPFERLFAWRTALRVVLCAFALAWSWGYLALVRAIAPGREALGLLGFATALQWAYYMGFYSFALSLAVGLWVLAYALGGAPLWSVGKTALVASVLYVQSRMHVMGAELTGIALALSAVRSGPPAQFVRIALAGVPALLVAVQTALVAPAVASALDVPSVSTTLYTGLRLLGRVFVSGPAWRSFPPVFAAFAGVVCALVRVRTGAASRVEQGVLIAGSVLLALAVLAPLHLRYWEYFSPRFTPFGVLLCCALLPAERLAPAPRAVLAVALAGYCAASVAWAAGYNRTLVARTSDVLAAMNAPLRRRGPRLTLSLASQVSNRRSEVPFADPLLYASQLFLIEQGGIGTSAFMVIPQIHELLRLERDAFPPVPGHLAVRALREQELTPGRRAALLDFVAFSGAAFTDVVLIARPSDADHFVARGYEPAFRQGRVLIAAFRGCVARVHVAGLAPAAPPARVEIGWPSRREVFASATASARTGSESVEVARSPCGRVWFRVQGLPPGARCAGADADGLVYGEVSSAGPGLQCDVTSGTQRVERE